MIVTHCKDCEQDNKISEKDYLTISSGLTEVCEWCGSNNITKEYGQ